MGIGTDTMNAINKAAQELNGYGQEKFEPYEGVYRINDGDYVSEKNWKKVWNQYPSWWSDAWMLAGNGTYNGFVDPFRTRFRLCFPIARAVGALHGVSPPPTHGGLQPGNGARSAARTLRIFFWTVRLRRIDHTGVAPPVNVAAPPAGSRPSYDWNRFGR